MPSSRSSRDGGVAQLVVSDRADERDGGAQPRGGDGLVGALAAPVLREAPAGDGLARRGQAGDGTTRSTLIDPTTTTRPWRRSPARRPTRQPNNHRVAGSIAEIASPPGYHYKGGKHVLAIRHIGRCAGRRAVRRAGRERRRGPRERPRPRRRRWAGPWARPRRHSEADRDRPVHRVRGRLGQHRVRRLLAAARDRSRRPQARPRVQDQGDRPVQPRPPDLQRPHRPRPQGRLHPGRHPRQRAHRHDRGDEPAQGPGQQLQAQPRDPRSGHARVHPDAQRRRRRALPARERPDVGRDPAALPAARRPPAGLLPPGAGPALLEPTRASRASTSTATSTRTSTTSRSPSTCPAAAASAA